MSEPAIRNATYSIHDIANMVLRMARNEDFDGKGIYIDFPFSPIGAHVSNANISSVTTLTAPTGATKILWQVMTANARYTLSGTNPSASSGFQIKAGDPPFVIELSDGVSIKVIQESGGADLEYEWGR